jgi:hypothetical protein
VRNVFASALRAHRQRDPFADLPLLGELRARLEANFLEAERSHLPRERLEADFPVAQRSLAPHVRLEADPLEAQHSHPPRGQPGGASWLSRPGRSAGQSWHGRTPRRSRGLLALAMLLAVGGSAAAAVTLTDQRSEPLSGSVPPTHGASGGNIGFSEAGKRYRIVFAPQLSGGEAGWRTVLEFRARGGYQLAAEGEIGYPTARSPLVGGAGVNLISMSGGRPGDGYVVDYALGAPRVAAIRLGARTIETRTGTTLPAGDRAAVFFRREDSRPVVILPPGAHVPYYMRVPALPTLPPSRARERRATGIHRTRLAGPRSGPSREVPARHSGNLAASAAHPRILRVRATPLLALDRAGQPIPAAQPRPGGPSRSAIRSWQVRSPSSASTAQPRVDLDGCTATQPRPAPRQPGCAAATHPLPGACELAQRGLRGLTPEWGHVLAQIEPVADAEGELFLSCVDTEFYLHGWPLDAAVLLNAEHPGRTPGQIPSATPLAGHPDEVDAELGNSSVSLTARRVGAAWLVVAGGRNLAQRLRVLDALRISRLAPPGR